MDEKAKARELSPKKPRNKSLGGDYPEMNMREVEDPEVVLARERTVLRGEDEGI